MTRRRPLAHPVTTGETHLPIERHAKNAPTLPAAGKGQTGQPLRRPQRDHQAATVVDFRTAVPNGTVVHCRRPDGLEGATTGEQLLAARAGVAVGLAVKGEVLPPPMKAAAAIRQIARIVSSGADSRTSMWFSNDRRRLAGSASPEVPHMWETWVLAVLIEGAGTVVPLKIRSRRNRRFPSPTVFG